MTILKRYMPIGTHFLFTRVAQNISGLFKAVSGYFFHQESNAPSSVALFFSMAVVGGILLKLWFGSFITIGYDDYRLHTSQSLINLSELQKSALAHGGSLAYTPQKSSGASCSQTDTLR